MEDCTGEVAAATEEEVWKLMERHAAVAHDEDPSSWNDETRNDLKAFIKTEEAERFAAFAMECRVIRDHENRWRMPMMIETSTTTYPCR